MNAKRYFLMNNLRFAPCVGVVNDCYEIIAVMSCEGRCHITVGREQYYEDSTGICRIHTPVHKIRIPQKALDREKEYTVHFAPCADKKRYFTVLGEEECEIFSFRPIEKTENINIYYIADIHSCYDEAEKCCSFFGDDLDLLIVNGDYGESDDRAAIEALSSFIARVTGGHIPVLVGRGNHDTRGSYSELVPEYIPTDNGKTYYRFSVGNIEGVVLDSGEDKVDTHPEYGTVNYFSLYRADEAKALSALGALDLSRYRFAVCHIPFNFRMENDIFNIDEEIYTDWTKNLERIGIELMLCGHTHEYALLPPGDENCRIPHEYPVVIGSDKKEKLGGTALTLKKDIFVFRFTDAEHNIKKEFNLQRMF